MIISKTNIVSTNSITLNTGTILSGALANLQDPDFSLLVSSSSATFKFTFASVGACQYVALHGLNLPIGTVVNVTGTGFSKTFTVTRSIKNLVFYVSSAVTLGSLAVEFIGSGTKTVSYIQAGIASLIDWGTSSGQSLHYLGYNTTARTQTTSQGLPTKRVQEEQAQVFKLSIQNAYKTWARTDLQAIYAMYNQFGVLSLLDYEEDNRPDESYALFDLSGADVKTHSQTTTLVDISFSFRAVA